MPDDLVTSLRLLTAGELLARLRSLAAQEREATAALVAHLAELEVRGLHLQAGYGSLFVFCRDALGLAEHECYNRIEVARAARRFPEILDRLGDGAVNLTAVRLLAPFLTAENHRQLLDEARGKKRSAVEEMVARLAPWPDAPAEIRKLPGPRAPAASAVPTATGSAIVRSVAVEGAASGAASPPAPVAPLLAARRTSVMALAPDRYRLQVTIGGETLEKLRLAKDMLRHALPTGDEAALLDRALTALLADLARSKFAATDRPRPSGEPKPGSRHIPAEVRRAVWLRDFGRCAFVARDGRRCAERAFLEFHHLRPFAVGGEATAGNIQLRCRRHNDYEARSFFDGRRDEMAPAPSADAAGGRPKAGPEA